MQLSEVVKLINFGCIDIKGYPLFTRVFNYITNNIPYYIEEFYSNPLLGGTTDVSDFI